LAARATISYLKEENYREQGSLMIAGSHSSAQTVSPVAMRALKRWIAENALHFEGVKYRANSRSSTAGISVPEPAEYSASMEPAVP